MVVKPIAKSYWRLIKAGNRTFDSVPETIQADVLTLANTDLKNNIITIEQYKTLIEKR